MWYTENTDIIRVRYKIQISSIRELLSCQYLHAIRDAVISWSIYAYGIRDVV